MKSSPAKTADPKNRTALAVAALGAVAVVAFGILLVAQAATDQPSAVGLNPSGVRWDSEKARWTPARWTTRFQQPGDTERKLTFAFGGLLIVTGSVVILRGLPAFRRP